MEENTNKVNIGKNQTMIANALKQSFLMSGLFVNVGVVERDNVLYIAAVPRYLFKDMITEDDKEDFAFVAELPMELSIENIKQLQQHVANIGQAIMIQYVKGKRELIKDNSMPIKEEEN